MITRSQDKRTITRFENVVIKEVSEHVYAHEWETIAYELVSYIGKKRITLGEYSTEEKAIKVLDMIEKQYASYSCRYGSDCSSYAVFQMPQDSEV